MIMIDNFINNKNFNLFAVLFIIACVLIIYSNSLNNPFISDDMLLVNTPKYHNLSTYYSHPESLTLGELNQATYVLSWHFFGGNVLIFHLTNIIFHLINTVLVYWLVNILFGNKILSFFTSLLFAIHPANNQVAAWISGRGYAFLTIFYLLSIIFYIRSLDFKDEKRILFYILSLFCFLITFFAQVTTISLPVILIIYSLFFKGHLIAKRSSSWLLVIPYFLIIAAVSPILFPVTTERIASYISTASKYQFNIWPSWGRITIVAKSIFYYLRLFLFPAKLGFYHPGYFEHSAALEKFDLTAFLSFFTIISTSVFALAYRKKYKELSFAILFFYITITPFTNIVYLHAIVAERYAYLASIGFCLALSFIVLKSLKAIREKFDLITATVMSSILIMVLFIPYGFRAYSRNLDWKNWEVYYNNEVQNDPKSKFAHNSLGGTISAKDPERALREFQSAIQLDSKYVEARYNLGLVYFNQKKLTEAEQEFKAVIQLAPDFATAYDKLSNVYLTGGKIKEAFDMEVSAIRLIPNNSIFYNNLGVIYTKMNDIPMAISSFRKALELNPGLKSSQLNLDNVLRQSSK